MTLGRTVRLMPPAYVKPWRGSNAVGEKVVSTLLVWGTPQVRLCEIPIVGAELDSNFNNICVRSFILTGAPIRYKTGNAKIHKCREGYSGDT